MTSSKGYDGERSLPVGQVATRLGVSVSTVRRWERQGKLTAFRTLGNQRRFSESDVEDIRAEETA